MFSTKIKAMVRYLFLLLFTAGFLSFAHSQSDLGIKLGVGFSQVTNGDIVPNGSIEVSPALSGQVGMFYEKGFEGKGRIGAEALITYIQSLEHYQAQVFDNITGMNLGLYEEDVMRELFYFTVPAWYGVKLKRWTLTAGVQAAFLIYGEIWREDETGRPQQVSNWVNGRLVNTGRFDWGPRLAVFYDIHSRLSIEATTYHGLKQTLFNEGKFDSYVQQATLGLRFYL